MEPKLEIALKGWWKKELEENITIKHFGSGQVHHCFYITTPNVINYVAKVYRCSQQPSNDMNNYFPEDMKKSINVHKLFQDSNITIVVRILRHGLLNFDRDQTFPFTIMEFGGINLSLILFKSSKNKLTSIAHQIGKQHILIHHSYPLTKRIAELAFLYIKFNIFNIQ
jgi:hypothetical protein